ncbi:putative ABC transporter C family member 15 [Senna tora]|uniref:ABC-type xenobiotic transporter n=1 Tax=Senna tora TaxID=362788 RepID=A0A834TS87_9FABA|nr:putative ABC transporter C family member 15 [Senna tora]
MLEHVMLPMELAFLAILLIHLLQKGVNFLRNHNHKLTHGGISTENHHPTVITIGFAYKTSITFSLLLLAVHISLLLMMITNGDSSQCNSKLEAFASQSILVFSWVISVISLCMMPKFYTKFPWMLRSWWLLSFLFSIITLAFHTHFKKGQIGTREYVDMLGLLASTCLLGISVRGRTGSVLATNGISEPLLSEKLESESKRVPESLYGKSTFIQLITFSWLNPLFALGYKKPLEQNDIPDVDIRDSAEFLSNSLDESLRKVKEKDGTTNPSVYEAIYLFGRKKAALNACFAVVNAAASYVGPYLITDFVNFLGEKGQRGLNQGFVLSLAFLCAKMIETICQRQWIFGARQLGLRLRAALISHVYKKGLVLSSRSRQGHSGGEIMNYMSVDVQRITDFMYYINVIWMLPVQISLAVYILHTNLGLGSLAALAATLTIMTFNIPFTRTQKRYQAKIMEAKDNRMKATSEVLKNMKSLKLEAWDSEFQHRIEELRGIEYTWLWKALRQNAFSAFIFWGSPTFISVVTFWACIFLGIELQAGRVLSAFATFRMLQDPIFSLPDLLNVIAQGKVSVDRIASFLREEEIQHDAIESVDRDQTEYDIVVEKGRFSWDFDSRSSSTLDGIDLRVKRGTKVAICGTVGSGKSSLLCGVLGEIYKQSGSVKISGTKAYVAQAPWILTGTIRDNITFGKEFDKDKYDKTIEACALKKDFELFSCGDLTEIGERGINMSGGQKQRIQIARAVYQDADIYLLDDPFSAVDAHTGTHLFKECLMGILREKTILYVTHQVEFLPAADQILVMQNGRIAQAGKFEELLKQNIGFEVLVGAHSQALESILTVENSSKIEAESNTKGELERAQNDTDQGDNNNSSSSSSNSSPQEINEKDGKLVQDEERERGSISKEVYWTYMTTFKGGAMVPFILLAQSSFQALQVASNYWMAWVCPTSSEAKPIYDMNFILLIYMLLSVGSAFCVLLRAILVVKAGLRTAQTLFINMLQRVLRAPMSFFDSTPTGRILNRASTDQSVLDLEMAMKLGWCAFSVIQILGTIAVMSQVAWQVFVIFIPVTAVCIWYQRYYTPTARELARLSQIQIAPILHHFAESLAGAASIRAFDQQSRFVYSNLGLVDNFSRPWFHNVSAMEWLSYRLNLLSNFVFAFSLVLLVILPEGIINPSIAGLAVTYGINLNVLQASVIWNICNAENKMISVERILQYSNIKSEAALVIEDSRPPNNWPQTGTICFNNLQIRYAEHLPCVLKNISCTFPGRKKIGVVGRTGSGKSTLIQAIFRIVEPREGSIVIDDLDICKIGLHDLRLRLSIIPQDPAMFEGTIRGNLDPLHKYTDQQVWEALDKCQLGELVRAKEEKLDSLVVENGENWSAGQRQLVCLGRALLKKSRILVLDEATASVDSATDGIVQKIISQEFKDRTVVTIAHRIHTVIDSDLVLVLSDGALRFSSFLEKLTRHFLLVLADFIEVLIWSS